jgi:hypothetical protein
MFNIFFLVFAAVAFGALLAMWVTRKATPEEVQFIPPEDAYENDAKLGRTVTMEDLHSVAGALSKEHRLEVKEKLINSPHEHYWITESKEEFFSGNYVIAFLQTTNEHRFATMTDILEFKDFIKSAGSSKGLFFTTGYFTKDVFQPLEGPKVTYYNKPKVLEEMDRLKLNRNHDVHS